MIIVIRKNKIKIIISSILTLTLILSLLYGYIVPPVLDTTTTSSQGFIKWVDFNIPSAAMEKALQLDIDSRSTEIPINWIQLLAYIGTKYGGTFKKYKPEDLDDIANRLKNKELIEDITSKMKSYNYYFEAYSAVLNGFVGEYELQVKKKSPEEETTWESKYGLKAFSPIAKGFGYSHYEDFGTARSYGFKRKHLGNDLMGGVGTPIIAIESGVVEALGWNMYGGWRIGIRSLDKKRYYYYAHLKKNKPYHGNLVLGKEVKAGDVIGYLGMTGYSRTENANNITPPHLHFGMQIIFDESQKEGNNEIWIDVYQIIEFLKKNRSSVQKDPTTKDFNRLLDIKLPEVSDSVS